MPSGTIRVPSRTVLLDRVMVRRSLTRTTRIKAAAMIALWTMKRMRVGGSMTGSGLDHSHDTVTAYHSPGYIGGAYKGE